MLEVYAKKSTAGEMEREESTRQRVRVESFGETA